MGTIALLLKVDAESVVDALEDARAKLAGGEREVVLDFSSVCHIDSGALKMLEELAGLAHAKTAKLALRAVNVDVYKVLKLVRLTSRLSFLD